MMCIIFFPHFQIVKVDPNQYIHGVKLFDEESLPVWSKSIQDLTWELPDVTTEINHKRQGHFTGIKKMKKKIRLNNIPKLTSINNSRQKVPVCIIYLRCL